MGQARPFDPADSRPIERPELTGAATSDKLLGLELLRFLSALAVLLFHYRHFARLGVMPAIERDTFPFYSHLWPLYEYGQFGVQVFWCISGYIFFWKYGAAILSGAVAARDFFWLRFSRLYPLHIVTLLSVIGLQAIHRQFTGANFVYSTGDPGLFVRQIFLATDWGWPAPFSFNGPIWSISAEVAVYAAFFLMLRRFAPSLRLCIAVIIAGLILQIIGLGWVSIGCATFFFAGGLAALAPANMRSLAGLALVALIVALAASDAFADRGKLPTILLLTVPCLLVLLAGRWRMPERWQRPIQAAGNLTYSSYLLHFPLQLLLAIGVAASGVVPPLTSPLFLTSYLAVTLTVAAASYRLFELPAQRRLRRHTLKSNA
jgi:peptidoglycan/LPS O-acetylase OafA/YrhL